MTHRLCFRHVPRALVCAILLTALVCSALTAPADDTGPATERAELERFVDDFFAAYRAEPFDLDRWITFFHPDVEFSDASFGIDFDSRAALREQLEQARVGAPGGHENINFTIGRTLIDGEQAIVEGSWTGTFRDQPFDVRFVMWLTVRDGAIIREIDLADSISWMEQVGLAEKRWDKPAVHSVAPPIDAPDLARDEAERLVHAYFDVYRQLDPSTGLPDSHGFRALYDPNVRFIDPTFRLDLQGFEENFELLWASISKPESSYRALDWTVERIAVDGPRVAFHGTWSGTFRDRPFDVPFVTVWTVRDGLIVDHTDYFAAAEWSRQVGL